MSPKEFAPRYGLDHEFPVESEEDLIAKAAYLRSLRFGQLEHTPGEERKEPDKEQPEPPGPPEGKGRPGGIPAISGVKRKDAPPE